MVGRQLFITDFGEEIAEAAKRILREVESINYKLLGYQGELAGKLKISVVSTGKYVMPYFLSGFIREHTGVDLIMDVTNKARVVESLEENEVDFALVSVLPEHLSLNKVGLMRNVLHLVANPKYFKNVKLSKSMFSKDTPLSRNGALFVPKGNHGRQKNRADLQRSSEASGNLRAWLFHYALDRSTP